MTIPGKMRPENGCFQKLRTRFVYVYVENPRGTYWLFGINNASSLCFVFLKISRALFSLAVSRNWWIIDASIFLFTSYSSMWGQWSSFVGAVRVYVWKWGGASNWFEIKFFGLFCIRTQSVLCEWSRRSKPF